MAQVCCIGGAHVDVGLHLIAEPVEGTSNPARSSWGVGGVATNVGRVLAALGVSVSVVSEVGSDPEGDRVVAALAAAGIETSGIGRSASEATALYAAVLGPDGGLHIGAAVADIYERLDRDWAESAAARAAGADLVFLEANLPAAVIGMIAARLPEGVLLVADPVSRPKSVRLGGVLPRLDVLFAGRDEAEALSGTSGDAASMAAALQNAGPGIVVVSRGPEGVVVADAAGVAAHAAIRPDRVVDVTGAGDALLGGFICGLLEGGPVPPIRWGLAAASLAVASPFAVPSDLTRERIATLAS